MVRTAPEASPFSLVTTFKKTQMSLLCTVIPIISKKVIHGEGQYHKVCTLSFWFTQLVALCNVYSIREQNILSLSYLQDVNYLFDIDGRLLDEQS
jgi:hypothetical protein